MTFQEVAANNCFASAFLPTFNSKVLQHKKDFSIKFVQMSHEKKTIILISLKPNIFFREMDETLKIVIIEIAIFTK